MALAYCESKLVSGQCEGQKFRQVDGEFWCTECNTVYTGTAKLLIVGEEGGEIGTVVVEDGQKYGPIVPSGGNRRQSYRTARTTSPQMSTSEYYDHLPEVAGTDEVMSDPDIFAHLVEPEEFPPGEEDTVVFKMDTLVAALEAEAVEVDHDDDLENGRVLAGADSFDTQASIDHAESGDLLDEPTAGGTLLDPGLERFRNILVGSDPHFGSIEGTDRPMSEPEDEEDDTSGNTLFVGDLFAQSPEPEGEEPRDSTASTEESSEDTTASDTEKDTESISSAQRLVVVVQSGRTDRSTPLTKKEELFSKDLVASSYPEPEKPFGETSTVKTNVWLILAAAVLGVLALFIGSLDRGDRAPIRARVYLSFTECVEQGVEENGLNPETMREHFAAACKEQGYE